MYTFPEIGTTLGQVVEILGEGLELVGPSLLFGVLAHSMTEEYCDGLSVAQLLMVGRCPEALLVAMCSPNAYGALLDSMQELSPATPQETELTKERILGQLATY